MEKGRPVLGRGLRAIIPQGESDQVVLKVPVSKLRPNPHQPRHAIAADGLEGLAQSIRERGVIQPIIVAPQSDGGYQIISGERRFRAAVLAGLSEVPALVRRAEAREHLELALIENLQREDLNSMEEAEAYRRLLDQFSYTEEELSRRLGKGRSTITNRLRLLKLPPSIQEDIMKGTITEGHARALLQLEGQAQLALRDEIVRGGLSVREAEARGKQPAARPVVTERRLDPNLSYLEEKLRGHFSTKVKIIWGGKKGRVEIEFYSQEDLQRIIDILESH